MNICVKYARCVKIWLSLDICVNVWKYGHLCGNVTFIGYFYEICPMCENMAISEVCAVYWSLVFSFWWSVCNLLKSSIQFLLKQKGDARTEHASHILVKGDTHCGGTSPFYLKGDARCGGMPPFYLICTKKKAYRLFSMGMLLAPACGVAIGTHTCTYVYQWAPCGHGARSTEWSTRCIKSSKHIDCRGFKSWWAWVLVGKVGLNL
jgi:hypothetical protein